MSAAIDLAAVFARALVFIASLQAAGGALFLLSGATPNPDVDAQSRRLIVWMAGAAVVLIAVRSALEPARMAGSLSGSSDPFLLGLFWRSDVSSAQLARLAGVVLLWAACVIRGPWTRATWLVGAGLVVVSFALMGHTRTHGGGLLTILLVAHLAAVAFWFGALLPLSFTLRQADPAQATVTLTAFSRLAVWIVPVLLAAGLGMAWILLGTLRSLLSPYGFLLLIKLAGVSALVALGAYNRYRLTPAIAATDSTAVAGLKRTVAVEIVLMLLIFIVTAFMTTWYSPP